ncbi:MAG: hypothetical protein HDR86_03135 [Bacteroides sp.]|nr:hypothetical protein [Bacteroides sp.]
MKQFNSINQSLNAIFNDLSERESKYSVVEREKLNRRSSALAVFAVFDRTVYKQKGARPHTRYAIYPEIGNPDRIGSVAVYTQNISDMYIRLRNQRSLFGRTIASVKVEQGIRPFIDIIFER